MKVRFEIDDHLAPDEVIMRAPLLTDELAQVKQKLEQQPDHSPTLTFFKGQSTYFFPVQTILFFEAAGRQIQAHTATEVYTVHYRLYELEALLPNQFMRVSKSTILNTTKIHGLSRSLSVWMVTFQESHKQAYVSRRYYKQLKAKLDEKRL